MRVFAWGVVRAIDFAEQACLPAMQVYLPVKKAGRSTDGNSNTGKVYSLGDIIHNSAEVKRLSEMGLETISVDQLETLEKGSKVLIRAHGEPPATYNKARELGLEIIDATCPVVTKVQERIKKFLDRNFQIIIFGKKDHAEVIGLNGVTGNKAIIVLTVDEISTSGIDFSRPTVLFSQTTMDRETFSAITEILRSRIRELYVGSIEDKAVEFHAKNTICGQVSGRDKKLREFAKANDVIIFAAGKKSSNGKVLYNIAKEENPNTYFIESEEEINPDWFKGVETIGITGATSTPKWLMERIKEYIQLKIIN